MINFMGQNKIFHKISNTFHEEFDDYIILRIKTYKRYLEIILQSFS